MAKSIQIVEAVIPAAGTDSATITVPTGKTLLGFQTRSVLVGTTLKFKTAVVDTGTPVLMRTSDGSADLSVAVIPSRHYPVNPSNFESVKYLQLNSSASETGGATIDLVFGQL